MSAARYGPLDQSPCATSQVVACRDSWRVELRRGTRVVGTARFAIPLSVVRAQVVFLRCALVGKVGGQGGYGGWTCLSTTRADCRRPLRFIFRSDCFLSNDGRLCVANSHCLDACTGYRVERQQINKENKKNTKITSLVRCKLVDASV